MEYLEKKDLRVKKTKKALYNAMITLLTHRNFNNLTINDLCSEALVSRATFYAHFHDKYDLLDYFLSEVRKSVVKDWYDYDELEREVNQFVSLNKKLITNILKDANSETLSLVRRFMSAIVELSIKRTVKNGKKPQHIILNNFLIGGLINLITWMSENSYPPEVTMMNPYLYKMLEALTYWDMEQEKTETAT